MDWEDTLALLLIVFVVTFYVVTGWFSDNQAYGQEAVNGVNGAFGGVSTGLRGILDSIGGIEDWFDLIGCHLMGLFTGYDNLPEGSKCL